MNNIFRLVFVLGLIAIGAGVILSGTYDLTKAPIAEQKRLELLASLNAILPMHDNEPDADTRVVITGKDRKGRDVGTVFYFARQAGKLVGIAFKMVTPEGYSGDIEIMMGVTPGGSILGVEVLAHLETPGLGDAISKNKKWRESFNGRNLEDGCCKVKKDGGKIDQFAGATISPRAVATVVTKGLELYKERFLSKP